MASNDDNPEPPSGLRFEDYMKTNTLDFPKPQETNPFIELVSHLQDENLIHILRKCILALPAVLDNELEEEADSPKDDTVVLNDLFELVERAKKNKLPSPKETSGENKNFLSSSTNNQTPACRSDFLVAYSSHPSPNVETAYIGSPDRASSISRNRVSSSSSFSHLSSRSSNSSCRPTSQSTPSSNNRSCASGSRVCMSCRSYCSSRRHRSYDSCSRSPEETCYRKKEEDSHRHSRHHGSCDFCRRSPKDTYCRKNEENRRKCCKSRPSLFTERWRSRRSTDVENTPHNEKEVDRRKRSRTHRSYDSCRRSPEDTYYRKNKEDLYKCRKSGQSLFNERSSSRGFTYVEDTQKKRLKWDASTKASIQLPNFPVDSDDDYSLILPEEMKRRRLLVDSNEERNARIKKGRSLAAAAARIDSNECTEALPEDQADLIILGSDNNCQKSSDVKFSQDNKKFDIPNNFFCDLCQLALNSELMWESHINGKNHAKQVKKQTVYEIAKGSLAVPVTPAIVSENAPRFANALPGKKRLRINAIPRLQRVINETRTRPMPGLDYVQEIISDMDVNYYCELCDAPCQSSSIMPHLFGFRHQLGVVREISPVFYEINKSRHDWQFVSKINSLLKTHERMNGRGSIKVFREIDDPCTKPAYDLLGPSWRSSSFPSNIKKRPNDGESENGASKDRWLDMSKGDFYCTLCNSHMNNLNMWEAHVRGKRHLANAKKIPGEYISKMKSERLHGATSKLEEMIDEELIGELVVGLDFIRETHGFNGEIYNCFLCGSCSTNFDIIDHILLLKHRTKYLEKLHVDGIENAIEEIDSLELKEHSYRIALINSECRKMLKRYGRGKVEVYQSKN